MNPNTRQLHITAPVNGNRNYVFNSKPLPITGYSHVVVRQIQYGPYNYYHYEIWINGKQLVNVVNQKAVVLQNVKYYVGDPWYTPAKTELRNIKLHKHAHKCKYIFL